MIESLFSQLALDFQTFLEKNKKMSSSLSKILEISEMNFFNSNSQLLSNKKYYEISTIYETEVE